MDCFVASLLVMMAELHPRHHHVFDLDILFHAVMRALAAEATFLDAAERRDFRCVQAGVHADHTGLQRFRDAPDPAEIAPRVMAALKAAGVEADYFLLDSDYGHTASGRDWAKWAPRLRQFMKSLG